MAVLARRPGAPRGARRNGDMYAHSRGRYNRPKPLSKLPKKTAEQRRLDAIFKKFGHGSN